MQRWKIGKRITIKIQRDTTAVLRWPWLKYISRFLWLCVSALFVARFYPQTRKRFLLSLHWNHFEPSNKFLGKIYFGSMLVCNPKIYGLYTIKVWPYFVQFWQTDIFEISRKETLLTKLNIDVQIALYQNHFIL